MAAVVRAGSRPLSPLSPAGNGVRVTAAGGFDTATWQSTGIEYSVAISSDATAGQLAHLLEVVDQVAEIPQALRAGTTVQRVT